jgi:hypothetical protein
MSYEPIPEQIPTELRELNQWVCWRFEERNGKETKIPINAATGHEADCTDRREFASFDAAMRRFRKYNNLDGIGFVFHDDDPFVGIDLDDCITNVYTNGSLFTQLAQDVLRRFPGTYAECSPSGTGIKLWIRGSLPIPPEKTGRKIPKLGIETYCRGRYFTVTSQMIVDSKSGRDSAKHPVVVDHNDELQRWFSEVFPERGSADKKDNIPATPVSAGVMEIVEKASGSRNGDKFRQLWAGDCSEFGDDQSSGDLAFCSMLAFWCGGNANLIDEVFRASGLMREKWDRDDYRTGTIEKAIASCREFYDWNRPKANIVLSVPRSQETETNIVLSVPESPAPEIQWPELIDLEEPPIDRLPPELLPGWYGEMIRAVAVSTETPVEMAALVALGAISTATMRKYEILIESGFTQSLNLYCVSVMEPGNRKSAVFKALMAAIDQFERELRQAAIEIIRTAESQFQTWKRRVDDLRGKAAKAKSHGEFVRMQQEIENLESQTPVVPPLPQLTADDATPESICGMLAGNDERLTLSSAEPDLFDMMLGRYSSKPNLGIYLKGHDGDAHKENRKSGVPVSLASPLLTIV